MRHKHLWLTMPLALLGLVGCDWALEDSSVTSSPDTDSSSVETSSVVDSSSSVEVVVDPVELTVEDVEVLLSDLAAASVNGYTYLERVYSDSYIDGTIYNNSLELIKFDIYENAFDSELTIYSDIESVTSKASDTSADGRYASYVLNDDYYLRGVQGISDDTDYVEYHENNMYIDLKANGLASLDNVVSNVTIGLVTPDSMWPSSYDFTVEEFSTYINDDGNIVCTVSADAPEEGWYGHEIGEATLEVTPDGTEIVSLSFMMAIYDMGYEGDDLDVGANSYYYYKVSEIEYGDPLTGDVEPFDFDAIAPDRIYDAPAEVVENIADGDIDDDTVFQILDNIDAYTEGTISSTTDAYILSVYDSVTWEDLGAAKLTQQTNRYLDNIKIIESTYTFDDVSIADVTSKTQYHALAEGVEVATQDSAGNVSRYVISSAYVSSLDYYLSAAAFTSDTYITEAISYVLTYGFTSNVLWTYWEYDAEKVSATKSGDTIEIVFNYDCKFAIGETVYYDNSYKVSIKIVDDFVTNADVEEVNEGFYYKYTMTKGDLVEFTGTLI